MNRRALVQNGFIGSFDAPWSEWSPITDPDPYHPKGRHPQKLCHHYLDKNINKKDFLKSISNLHISLSFLLMWNSLQCRRFLWARNLLAKAPCWNFPKRGGNGASQREREGGREREEKTPTRKHCENEKHPLIRRAWPLFRKWVADNRDLKQPRRRAKWTPSGSVLTKPATSAHVGDVVHMAFRTWHLLICRPQVNVSI